MADSCVPGQAETLQKREWTLTQAALQRIASAAGKPFHSCQLRVSISTEGSESAVGDAVVIRKKVWRRVRGQARQQAFIPLSDQQCSEMVKFWPRLEEVYKALEDEIEPFSMSECRPKVRDCTLTTTPVSSLLLKRRARPLPAVSS